MSVQVQKLETVTVSRPHVRPADKQRSDDVYERVSVWFKQFKQEAQHLDFNMQPRSYNRRLN